jgi:hypothetical protein
MCWARSGSRSVEATRILGSSELYGSATAASFRSARIILGLNGVSRIVSETHAYAVADGCVLAGGSDHPRWRRSGWIARSLRREKAIAGDDAPETRGQKRRAASASADRQFWTLRSVPCLRRCDARSHTLSRHTTLEVR